MARPPLRARSTPSGCSRSRGAAPPARRTAAVALAVLNAGVAVQAAFAQAMFSARRLGFSIDPFFEPGAWLASRLLLLAGTLLISMLILRRLSR